MLSALRVGLSALRAYGDQLHVTSHNVANSTTGDFRPQKVGFKEQSVGGVDATVRPASPSIAPRTGPHAQPSVELSTEMSHLLLARRGYEANIQAAKSAAETEDSVLDLLA